MAATINELVQSGFTYPDEFFPMKMNELSRNRAIYLTHNFDSFYIIKSVSHQFKPLVIMKYVMISVIVVFISCSGSENDSSAVQIQTDVTGEWQELSEMPTPRSEIDGVVYNGVIYIAGGFYNGSSTSGAFEAYHIEEDRWEILPDLPQPAHHPSVAAGDGKIYVSGGWYGFGDEGQQNLDSFWAFDIEQSEWLQKAEIPYNRGAHRKVFHGGYIYLITGSGPEANEILRYHPDNDFWEILDVQLERSRDHSAITLAGDDLYIISGRGGGTEQPRVDILNLSDFEFRRAPDIPTPRGGHGAEYSNGKIYVIGGEVGGDTPYVLDSVEVFDIELDEWIEGPILPYTIHGLASAQHDGNIYLIGGATAAFFDTFETLTGYNYVLNLQ